MNINNLFHKPVLLKEVIKNLIINKNGIYVDATFGLGGHSKAILDKLDKNGHLIAIDQDKESIKYNKIKDPRFMLVNNNFSEIKNILNKKKVSGILLDLGLSSFQIEHSNRGFSHQLNEILDMRINQESKYYAKDVINKSSRKKLFKIFREYGDFKNCKNIVDKILKNRIKNKIENTFDLKKIFFIKGSFRKKKNFFSRLFQSIRIEVNNEIGNLKKFLINSIDYILPKGRILIISYHSLEDRIIKNFFKKGILCEKIFTIYPFLSIHKKVIKPDVEELLKNPRSRSARLRVAEKNSIYK